MWPLAAGFIRMAIALGGGWLAVTLTGSLHWLFAAIALGLFLHGVILFVAVWRGSLVGRQTT
jgi:hypothetical protein